MNMIKMGKPRVSPKWIWLYPHKSIEILNKDAGKNERIYQQKQNVMPVLRNIFQIFDQYLTGLIATVLLVSFVLTSHRLFRQYSGLNKSLTKEAEQNATVIVSKETVDMHTRDWCTYEEHSVNKSILVRSDWEELIAILFIVKDFNLSTFHYRKNQTSRTPVSLYSCNNGVTRKLFQT